VVQQCFFSNAAGLRDWGLVLKLDDFSILARAKLHAEPQVSWNRSDDDANERARLIAKDIVPKHAAVLIGIVARAGEPTVLFTQRHAGLAKHAGQISFPGGKLDQGETALQAALREAEEETGLASKFVSPLGYLDGYMTVTGYFVTPVVALVQEGFSLVPQANEVEEIFEVPLEFIMDDRNRTLHSRVWAGSTRHFYAYSHGDRYIWGATAGMLKNLSEMLHGA
jgi:8-oxo-dGTP pyrophosphatase MutT (NUDIX family)